MHVLDNIGEHITQVAQKIDSSNISCRAKIRIFDELEKLAIKYNEIRQAQADCDE
ncbi:MAG: hypothetical protein H6Q72_1492 [Firmicutes bacterium]|nr:hypothetical protein [Bacillota bacterium]